MKLGNILKRLEIDQEVRVTIDESEYIGTVVNHGYTESKPDPVEPWFDPGGASAVIELDESTIKRLDLEISSLRVTCGQYDGYPAWKTPVAALHQDEGENKKLGEVSDIQPVEEG